MESSCTVSSLPQYNSQTTIVVYICKLICLGTKPARYIPLLVEALDGQNFLTGSIPAVLKTLSPNKVPYARYWFRLLHGDKKKEGKTGIRTRVTRATIWCSTI